MDNWLVADGEAGGGRCLSCRLTRTRPGDDDPDGLDAFAKAEGAKRRWVFQIGSSGSLTHHLEDPQAGLAFDLLSSRRGPVTTGHADGLVT